MSKMTNGYFKWLIQLVAGCETDVRSVKATNKKLIKLYLAPVTAKRKTG